MTHRQLILVLVFAVILTLAACGAQPTEAPAASGEIGQQVSTTGGVYTDITVEELQTMLADKNFVFVNVHIPFEGNIPGTDLSIPYDQIAEHLDELPAPDAQIVLYCRSGRMSQIAAETLVGLGYTNVYNVVGGMIAWEQAGLTLER